MNRAPVILAAIVMAFLVACGGDGGWTDEERSEFIAGCTSGDAPEDLCACVADKMEVAFPDEIPEEAEIVESTTQFAQECLEEQAKG